MPAYVFDVNETLVDLRPLDPLLERVTGVPGIRPLWFARTLQALFAHTILGTPPDAFGTVAAATLEVVAAGRGRTVTDKDREELAATFRSLPLHPDVEPALRALHEAGVALAVCAQAPEAVLRSQLAPVEGLIGTWVSAGDTGAFKPSPQPYRLALEALGTTDAAMVAAHPWDLAGAAACGMQTVLVARDGVVADPLFGAPGRTVGDVLALAG